MPSDNLQNLVDVIDTDAIRNGDQLALVDALTRIHRSLNDSIAQLSQLRQQSTLTPMFCRLYKKLATQIVPTAIETSLRWETPPAIGDITNGISVGGMFDPTDVIAGTPVTGDHYIRLFEPGVYLLEAQVLWDTNVTGDRKLTLDLLGSLFGLSIDVISRVRSPASITTTTGLHQRVSSLVTWRELSNRTSGLDWSGRIAVSAYQDSGGDRTVGGVGSGPDHWFSATRIGAVR